MRPPGEGQLRNRGHKSAIGPRIGGGLSREAWWRLRSSVSSANNELFVPYTLGARPFSHPAPAISRLTSHRLKRKCPGTVAGLRSVARKKVHHGHALPDDRPTAWTTSVYLFRTLTICSRAQIVVLRQMLSPHVGCRSLSVCWSFASVACGMCPCSRLPICCSATVRFRPARTRAAACCSFVMSLSVCVSESTMHRCVP